MLDKYDIGIVGNWSNMNYGAELTYYALYRVLADQNYTIVMIEGKWKTNDSEMALVPGLFRKNPYPNGILAKLDRFQFQKFNERCDTYIVGSDQLWRPTLFLEWLDINLLSFIGHNKRKISYATSFGQNHFTASDEHISKMKFFLNRFQRISVREQSGVDICRDVFGVHADWMLDPVFLCDTEHYEKIIEQSTVTIHEPFVFCYIIHPTKEKWKCIQEIIAKLNQKIIFVRTLYDIEYDGWDVDFEADCKIEEWLYYLRNCDMVITDSFHAYCFSIIFKKQILPFFQTMNGSDSAERIYSLVNMLGMKMPEMLDSLDINQYIERNMIDYTMVEKSLEEERKRCKNWLFDSLKAGVVYDKTDLLWDVVRPSILELSRLTDMEIERKREKNRLKYGDRNIILFGTGRVLKTLFHEICSEIKVCAIVDNNAEKWGILYGDIKCASPQQILAYDNPYVIITVKNEAVVAQIRNQLENMGIQDIGLLSEWIEV